MIPDGIVSSHVKFKDKGDRDVIAQRAGVKCVQILTSMVYHGGSGRIGDLYQMYHILSQGGIDIGILPIPILSIILSFGYGDNAQFLSLCNVCILFRQLLTHTITVNTTLTHNSHTSETVGIKVMPNAILQWDNLDILSPLRMPQIYPSQMVFNVMNMPTSFSTPRDIRLTVGGLCFNHIHLQTDVSVSCDNFIIDMRDRGQDGHDHVHHTQNSHTEIDGWENRLHETIRGWNVSCNRVILFTRCPQLLMHIDLVDATFTHGGGICLIAVLDWKSYVDMTQPIPSIVELPDYFGSE